MNSASDQTLVAVTECVFNMREIWPSISLSQYSHLQNSIYLHMHMDYIIKWGRQKIKWEIEII